VRGIRNIYPKFVGSFVLYDSDSKQFCLYVNCENEEDEFWTEKLSNDPLVNDSKSAIVDYDYDYTKQGPFSIYRCYSKMRRD
jgi:hypothetical protein